MRHAVRQVAPFVAARVHLLVGRIVCFELRASGFVKKLKAYQKKHGMLQAQLAEKLGAKPCTLCMWFSGKRVCKNQAVLLHKLGLQ